MNKRIFWPGEEWLSYKIYLSEKTGEELIKNLQSIINEVNEDILFTKWFFIRYYDTSYHLRIRFYHPEGINLSSLNQLFICAIEKYINRIFIKDIVIDSYKREIERYPEIEKSETVFYLNSEFNTALHASSMNDYEKWLINLKYVDELLNHYGFSINQKLEYINNLKDRFNSEFNYNKNINKELNIKYNSYKEDIFQLLNKPSTDLSNYNSQEIKFLKENPFFFRNGFQFYSLESYLHMNFIRLFPNNNRLSECVTYNLLYKYYKNLVGKTNYDSKH